VTEEAYTIQSRNWTFALSDCCALASKKMASKTVDEFIHLFNGEGRHAFFPCESPQTY